MLLLLILLCFGCPLYYSMQSDGEDEPEEAEDLASSADLSFDEIRSVLNKPEKQVRLQPNPAASPRCAWQHCRRPGLGLEEGVTCRRGREQERAHEHRRSAAFAMLTAGPMPRAGHIDLRCPCNSARRL